MSSMIRATWLLTALLTTPALAAASPPVNHVVGDAGFVWRHGRLPTAIDGDPLRIEAHLAFVSHLHRARSSDGVPGDRQARRAALLDALDRYAARGDFPANTAGPARTPVFVDEHGAICAVGHLIEASAGRALAEDVAASFRTARLEQMRHDGLAAWVAQSGLDLLELAMIQPGYGRPSDRLWGTWAAEPPAERGVGDGAAWSLLPDGGILEGAFRGGQMDGAWVRRDPAGAIDGYGWFEGGAGTWLSWTAADGTLLAMGRYEESVPHGPWRFWWPNGQPSAEGEMAGGARVGAWRYFDQAGALLAAGPHAHGEVGRWAFHVPGAGTEAPPMVVADFERDMLTWFDDAGRQRLRERRKPYMWDVAVAWREDGSLESVRWGMFHEVAVVVSTYPDGGPRRLTRAWHHCGVTTVVAWRPDGSVSAEGVLRDDRRPDEEEPYGCDEPADANARPDRERLRALVARTVEASSDAELWEVAEEAPQLAELRPPTRPLRFLDERGRATSKGALAPESPSSRPARAAGRRVGPHPLWPCELYHNPVLPADSDDDEGDEDDEDDEVFGGARGPVPDCESLGERLVWAQLLGELIDPRGLSPEALGARLLLAGNGHRWLGHAQVELAIGIGRAQMPDRYRCDGGLEMVSRTGTTTWACEEPREPAAPLDLLSLIGGAWQRLIDRHGERHPGRHLVLTH